MRILEKTHQNPSTRTKRSQDTPLETSKQQRRRQLLLEPRKWPMPDGNLTKKTCFNRNHPCCVRKRSFFFHRALLSSDVTLPYPTPPHHHYGWPDTDISLVGTIKTVVAVTQRPWLLCLEMKVPSIQSFCCSIGSGCMLPGLDFAQLCRSLGQWQDFFRLRK